MTETTMPEGALEQNEASLVKFLEKKADEWWKLKNQPYLLSSAPIDMRIENLNYRDILGAEKLKAFVRRTENAGHYKLVEHPVKHAKVGIIPPMAVFKFDDAGSIPLQAGNEQTVRPPSGQRALISFLKALSELSNDEIDSVVIPTRVLVNLLGKK